MEKKLTRDPQDKMIAGVSAGLAKYFELEVTWVRIAFVFAVFFGGGGLLMYIILWIVVPEDRKLPYTYTDYKTQTGEPLRPTNQSKNNSNLSLLLGFILVVMGTYFLMGEFDLLPYWFSLRKLWPLIFIVFGLIILAKAKKRNEAIDEQPTDEKPIEDEFNNPNQNSTNPH